MVNKAYQYDSNANEQDQQGSTSANSGP